MLNNFIVSLYNKTGQKDENGAYVGTSAYVKDIDVDIQPYSTQLLLNQYGYEIKVNKRIFIDHCDSDVKIGSILKYTDINNKTTSYEVKVIPWDDGYMEVCCFGV